MGQAKLADPVRRALIAALLVIVPLAAYAPALRAGFVWDDHHAIEHGRLIGSLANLPLLFRHDAMYNSDGGRYAAVAPVDTYRPLSMAVLFIERALWGRRPWGFHLGSVLLHLGVTALLYRAARRLVRSREPMAVAAWQGPLVATLVFALHPTISEAVYWVSGLSDPLAVGGVLAALLVARGGAAGPWRGAATAGLVWAATLCKETAFLLLPTLALLVAWRPPAGRLRALAPLLMGAVAGLACRRLALGRLAAIDGPGHLVEGLSRAPAIWLDGLVSLLWPRAEVQLSLGERYASVAGSRTGLALLLVALLGGVAGVRLRRGRPLLAAALLGLVTTLLPVALLTRYPNWTGWGRYLYASAALFALPLAELLAALPLGSARARALGRGVVVSGLALLFAATFTAGARWRDDRAFAEAQVGDHPASAVGQVELAGVELNEGHPEASLAAARRALAMQPGHPLAASREAMALYVLGRKAAARTAARVALQLDAADYNARYIEAAALLAEGSEVEAAATWLALLDEQPHQEPAWQIVADGITARGGGSRFAVSLRRAATDPRWAAIAPRLRELTK